MSPDRETFRFGVFEADTRTGELRKSGLRIRLQGKPFQLLAVLLKRSGELVSREDLRNALWSADTYVEFDRSLNIAVRKLRSALNDTAEVPRYVETLRGRGYRFIAPVDPAEPTLPSAPTPATPENGKRDDGIPSAANEQPYPRTARGGWVPALPVPLTAAVIKSPVREPPLQGSESGVIGGLVKRRRITTAGIAAGVMIAALGYALYRVTSEAPAPRAALEFSRVTSTGDVQQADISPDGKYVAYVRQTGGGQRLWLKQLATDSDIPIADLGGDACTGVAFSPDGSYVYFVRQDPQKPNGDLYQVSALGGSARRDVVGISGPPAFSPDGQRLAFVRETISDFTLLTASRDGSGERTLASYKDTKWTDNQRVAWSSDGKILAFTRFSPQPALSTIGESGEARAVAGGRWDVIYDLTWLPGKRDLVVAGHLKEATGSVQLYEVSPKGGEIRRITHDLSRYGSVGVSADGKTLLVVQEQHLETLQVGTPGDTSETRILSAGDQNRDGENGWAWTPDGKIVYAPGRSEQDNIWEIGTDGSNPQLLANSDASVPSYLPVAPFRGDFIAFMQRERNDDWNIWRMDRDGSNLKRLTQGGRNFSPAVSPDGQWVIFTHAQSGRNVLMKVPSGGGVASQLTDYDSIWPTVSPDGKWIAFGYSPSQDKPVTLALIPFAGGQPTKVFPVPVTGPYPVVWTPTPLAWTPDGRAIAFVNRVNGIDNIWVQPVAGGPPKPVTHFTSDRIFAFDWSRDGRLALSRGRESSDAVLIKNFH